LDPPVLLCFQGWNPLPTAASAKGGGVLLANLLHWAASMARGVELVPPKEDDVEQEEGEVRFCLREEGRREQY